MLTIQQIIRKKSKQSKDKITGGTKRIAGLMVRKGVKDFQVIKKAGSKIKGYGLKF